MTQSEWLQIYEIVCVALEVHNELGRGMEEAIYQEAMERELNLRGMAFETQKPLHTYYKGAKMKKLYVADLYISEIMVELKSVSQISSEHRAQLLNYMRITKSAKGLLINFGEKSLRVERYLYLPDTDDFILLTQSNNKQYIVPKN